MSDLPLGIYERLLDTELQELLQAHPEVRPVFRTLEDEDAPHGYAQFASQLLQQAFRITSKEERLPLLNRVIELLSATDDLDFLKRRKLLSDTQNQLVEVRDRSTPQPLARPSTPLTTSTLLTGQGTDPPLEHELRAEFNTADRVDILVSFIKWSGLRLLQPAFERLRDLGIPIRIISTSYMGASDPAALEWLAKQPNVEVRISYDTSRTRLHAKAYHFIRRSGFSTAYIGSANMSHAAMTQGLEWTVKVTAQDLPHILSRFVAEFSTYWESDEFEPFCTEDLGRFRAAINGFRQRTKPGTHFFAEITPRPFQLRILEALEAARLSGSHRNLVVAATGTGKTVISALDYQRFRAQQKASDRLLFVVHRKEILEQALACFRTVLRDPNFGELFFQGEEPSEWKHVFASVSSLNRRQLWERFGPDHFNFVVVDEAHHGKAQSYRPLFEHLRPQVLLGLTATPERMDGSSILPDFGHRFAAEIRLPEALEEKLLCPFHYFGVTDSIDLTDERFWRNGSYDTRELEALFTGDDLRARQRVDTILAALERYQPDLSELRAVGFCAGVKHAHFMARCFNEAGISASVLLGETPAEERADKLRAFREGTLSFLFTVDVLSEGVDVPDINLVLFLRPTESLTVFLQQLGRGLRHAPGKDCLTVLDFIGQTHRKYRMDTKFAALLSRRRQRIDREIEHDFPNLPPGCSIQLERVAREHILNRIRSVLADLRHFIPETIRTWEADTERPLTFGDFVETTGLSPTEILRSRTWSEWKALGRPESPAPSDPDLKAGRSALSRLVLRTDPSLLADVEAIGGASWVAEHQAPFSEARATAIHYLMWGRKAELVGVENAANSLSKWRQNPSVAADSAEIAAWRRSRLSIPSKRITLPFPTGLQLHAAYGSFEIKAELGLATLAKPGPAGQGVLHSSELKTYAHLVTFRKEEADFSPTTRYRDYPISRTQLHWESQSTVSQSTKTGQNYIHFRKRGYTVLFFARLEKKTEGETAPFIFLGPAKTLLHYENDRPISMVWELEYPLPAALFEEARAV